MDAHDAAVGDSGDSWWFSGKRDLVRRLLEKYADPQKAALRGKMTRQKALRILVVGGGTGEDLGMISRFGRVVVIEPDKRAAQHIPKKYTVLVKPLETAKVEGTFDVVIVTDVLEHIKDAKKAAHIMHGYLKKDGLLMGTVPARMSLWSSHDVALEHHRRYSKPLLHLHLKGYELVALSGWNVALFPGVWLFRKAKKLLGRRGVDAKKVPRAMDWLLKRILFLENACIARGARFPTGVSLVFVAKRKS